MRFFYHFSGNKVTNSRENPEWYFTQVLKWISAHESFLNIRIQQVLNRYGYQSTSAKVRGVNVLNDVNIPVKMTLKLILCKEFVIKFVKF